MLHFLRLWSGYHSGSCNEYENYMYNSMYFIAKAKLNWNEIQKEWMMACMEIVFFLSHACVWLGGQ